MSVLLLLAIILALSGLAFILGRARSISKVSGNIRDLHSLPGYYGWHTALTVLFPSIVVLVLWLVIQPMVLSNGAAKFFPEATRADSVALTLALDDARRVSRGLDAMIANGSKSEAEIAALDTATTDVRALLAEVNVALGSDVSAESLDAAKYMRAASHSGGFWMALAVMAVAGVGLIFGLSQVHPEFRARNRVEKAVLGLLILASSIAILTTVGIVWSMLSESISFFKMYPAGEFFFGLTWSPNFSGGSTLGFLPLLWGTLYITFVAIIVAVPLGLFTAIYLAEYASPKLRSWIKPLIEIIAGIPTVVFGLFALVTVGPILRDYFAQPLGLGTSGSSVMTAGIVIGILNIPFISSLADDIINSVPQSLRDGSFGLGATRSETVRQVILPAALPGIVGAVLLATSRAIGETMIVTMGAGAAAKLSLNPFEAMTTMTMKIVGQLTGDTDFASPETLVAFALGITLFVLTLGLNILALYIVRKYREQYE